MRGNSPYNPDYLSSLDLSAYGWPIWSSFFHQHTVWGSKLTWEVNNADGAYMPLVFVFPSRDPTIETINQDRLFTMKYVKKRLLSGLGNSYSRYHGSMYMSTHKMFGISKSVVKNDPAFTAEQDTVPGSQWFWYMIIVDSGKPVQAHHCMVKLSVTYYVTLNNWNEQFALGQAAEETHEQDRAITVDKTYMEDGSIATNPPDPLKVEVTNFP